MHTVPSIYIQFYWIDNGATLIINLTSLHNWNAVISNVEAGMHFFQIILANTRPSWCQNQNLDDCYHRRYNCTCSSIEYSSALNNNVNTFYLERENPKPLFLCIAIWWSYDPNYPIHWNYLRRDLMDLRSELPPSAVHEPNTHGDRTETGYRVCHIICLQPN